MRILLTLIFSFVFPVFMPAAGERIAGPVVAEVLRVRDGDTLIVLARPWPGHLVRVAVRVRGIDTPELRGRCVRERHLAALAKRFVEEMIGDRPVLLSSISGGKYFGRVLADVSANDVDLGGALLARKLAVVYRGRGSRVDWCVTASTATKKGHP